MTDFDIKPAPFEILEEIAELIINNTVEVMGRIGYCQIGPLKDNVLTIYPVSEELTSGKHDGEIVHAPPNYDLESILELFPDLRWGRWSTLDNTISFEITFRGYQVYVILRGDPFFPNVVK